MKKQDIAIVVPHFNEEIRIGNGEYLIRLSQALSATFIYVDDGSTDNTVEVLENVARITGAKVVKLEINHGKSEAVRRGIIAALETNPKPKFVGYLDADGAFSVQELQRNLDCFEKHCVQGKYNMYICSRVALAGREISRSKSRHYIARILMTLLGFIQKQLPYDTQSGFKLMRTDLINFKSTWDLEFHTKWFFDIELLCRLRNAGSLKIWEEPAEEWADVRGSKITWKSIPSIFLEFLYICYLLFHSGS